MLHLKKEDFTWPRSLGLAIAFLAVFVGFWNFKLLFPLTLAYLLIIGLTDLRKPAENKTLPPLHWLDLLLMALTLFEITNYFTSIYPLNSLFQLHHFLYFTSLYIIFRILFTNLNFKYLLFPITGGYAFLLSGVAFLIFLLLQTQLRLEGWNDASQFKGLFSPFSLANNTWATIGICFLPLPLIAAAIFRQYRVAVAVGLLAFVFINVGVLITFSRGAYLSLALFWFITILLLLIYRMVSISFILKYSIITGVVIMAFMFPSMKPFTTTLAMNKTVSQQRSTEGRLSIIESGICQVQDYKIFGVGGNNYPIVNDNCKDDREDQGYSGFTNNTYLQILIEKGILGLIIYAVFALGILISFFQKINKSNNKTERFVTMIAAAGFLAFGLREFFFSTFFYHAGVITIVAMLTVAAVPNINSKLKTYHFWSIFLGILLLTSSFIYLKKIQFNRSNEQIRIALDNWQANKVVADLSSEIGKQPSAANYDALQALMLAQIDLNINDLLTDSVDIKRQKLQAAVPYFESAIAKNPYDAGFYFNLGWTQFLMDRANPVAIENVNKALSFDPYAIDYLISAGLMQEMTGDTTAAFAKYERAIRTNPEVLDAPFFTNLQQRFPDRTPKLIQEIETKLQEQFQNDYRTVAAARYAKVLLAQGKTEAAKPIFERVIKELPNLSRPYYHLAMIYIKENNIKQAKKLLLQSLFIDQYDYLVNWQIGNLYAQDADTEGDIQTALFTYQQALKLKLRRSTAHYAKSEIKYQSYIGARNDLILQQLMLTNDPTIDIPETLRQIAKLYDQIEENELATHYKNLAESDLSSLQADDIINQYDDY